MNNLRRQISKNSIMELNVYDLNKDDPENVFITEDTRFDVKLTIKFAEGEFVFEDKGSWIYNWAEQYEGMVYDICYPELFKSIKYEVTLHVLSNY